MTGMDTRAVQIRKINSKMSNVHKLDTLLAENSSSKIFLHWKRILHMDHFRERLWQGAWHSLTRPAWSWPRAGRRRSSPAASRCTQYPRSSGQGPLYTHPPRHRDSHCWGSGVPNTHDPLVRATGRRFKPPSPLRADFFWRRQMFLPQPKVCRKA